MTVQLVNLFVAGGEKDTKGLGRPIKCTGDQVQFTAVAEHLAIIWLKHEIANQNVLFMYSTKLLIFSYLYSKGYFVRFKINNHHGCLKHNTF